MNDTFVQESLESIRQGAEIDAERSRDPQIVAERLRDYYATLAQAQRETADQVLCRWVLSDDEARRFDAVSLIGHMRIESARQALEQLKDRLRFDRSPGAKFEMKKIARVLALL